MEQQEIDAELSLTETQDLLASTSAAHLSYIGQDGTPRVVPVGFYWTGDEFVISTATTAPKVAAQMARIAVKPTWARFYDFGAGRVPQFLLDLAARSA